MWLELMSLQVCGGVWHKADVRRTLTVPYPTTPSNCLYSPNVVSHPTRFVRMSPYEPNVALCCELGALCSRVYPVCITTLLIQCSPLLSPPLASCMFCSCNISTLIATRTFTPDTLHLHRSTYLAPRDGARNESILLLSCPGLPAAKATSWEPIGCVQPEFDE